MPTPAEPDGAIGTDEGPPRFEHFSLPGKESAQGSVHDRESTVILLDEADRLRRISLPLAVPRMGLVRLETDEPKELAVSLASALERRYSNYAKAQPLNVITCENLTGAARVLESARQWWGVGRIGHRPHLQ